MTTTTPITASTPTSSTPKMALLKRQGMPVEQLEEADALEDARLVSRFPTCLDGALAVRERFRQTGNGDRIPRETNGKLAGEGLLVVTIVKQAVIEVEGQRTIVEDLEDVREDVRLREVATFLGRSWAAQAQIDWTVENWVAVIKFIKRNGSKGAPEEVLAMLLDGPEEWSPALLLSWEFTKREALGMLENPDHLSTQVRHEIEHAIEEAEEEILRTQAAFSILTRGAPEPIRVHIPGF